MKAAALRTLDVSAFRIPTDGPEADGTLEWASTTLVLVRLEAGGQRGLGYSYADAATARVISDHLFPALAGTETLDIPARWHDMARAVRNLGRRGIAAMAISAVDAALWDLKGKLLGASLLDLLGASREAIAAVDRDCPQRYVLRSGKPRSR